MGFSQKEKIYYGSEANQKISGAELIRYTERSTAPNFIKLQVGKLVDEKLEKLWLQKVLAMKEQDNFKLINVEKDQLGMEHYRYRQTYFNYPVEASMYLVHKKAGKVIAANGDYFPSINAATQANFSQSVAIQKAKNHIGAEKYMWEETLSQGKHSDEFKPTVELVVTAADGDIMHKNFVLAYKVDIYAQKPLSRNYVFVDALTGNILYTKNRIHTADTLGTAHTKYSGVQQITTDYTGSTFRLRESGRGNGVNTYDMNNGTSYGSATDFTDADNNWNNVNSQQDEVATDAHWGAEKTYDYYWNNFGRNSIDGNGFTLNSYVHYSNSYVNAFWDGQRMTYGDGNGTSYTPLVPIDVAGHEITHGLTSFTADLIYQNESGALNESFSDIFGAAIEFYSKTGDWLMGEECSTSGTGFRSMSNPNSKGDPDTYLGTNWYSGTADNGGVHTNSGVQNFWFYLLTDGGAGTNDNGDAYSVTGIGISKAAAISYRNLTIYLTSTSNYSDARFYAIQSAIDLYGACTQEVESTTDAWYAVGVGSNYIPQVIADFNATPTNSCSAPTIVQFSNTSVNASSFIWDFGDGNTSTQNDPTHTYTAVGTYDVQLIATGGACGSDTMTKTAFIVIDTSNACDVILSQSTSIQTQTACSGTVYDNGGQNNDYTGNTDYQVTIQPSGAANVTLNFSSFNFEDGYDYLYIYDGSSTSAPLIGAYTGSNLPNGGTITSTYGSITIRQYTDPFLEASGFAAAWNCNYATSAPTVDFKANITNACDGEIYFIDQSTNGPTSWSWNFGDGSTSTQQNPTHFYQNDGTYNVTLTATNSFGNNSITKNGYITVSRNAAPTSSGVTRCGEGSVTLSASGAGTIYWYNSATSTTPIGIGNTLNTGTVSSSTVFYAADGVKAPSSYVGPQNNSFGTGGYHGNSQPQALYFDVYKPLNLKSVLVYAGSSGNRTINLYDSQQNVIQSKTVNIPSGQSRVALDFNIQPGTSYSIGGANMDLYRNNSGSSYQYILPDVLTITGSTAGSDYYYYYYDWEVEWDSCFSNRASVPVTIVSGNADFSTSINDLTVDFTDNSTTASSWDWDFGDGNTSTSQNPTHTYTADGTYNVRLVVGTQECDTIIKEVQVGKIAVDNSLLSQNLKIYPNPFTEELNFEIPVFDYSKLTIQAFDMTGRKVADIFNGSVSSDVKMKWTEAQKLIEGAYIFRIQLGNEVIYKKFLKL